MQCQQLRFGEGFDVAAGNTRSQAAAMTLAPGDSTGGPSNKHEHSDQWLHILGGEGEAVITERKHALSAGVLILIERGETHEIRNTGSQPLQTLNLYVPPAYP